MLRGTGENSSRRMSHWRSMPLKIVVTTLTMAIVRVIATCGELRAMAAAHGDDARGMLGERQRATTP